LNLRGVFCCLFERFFFCICLRAGLDGYFFVLAGNWHLQQTSKSKKKRVKSLGSGLLWIAFFACFFF